jgi:hypothetical protein
MVMNEEDLVELFMVNKTSGGFWGDWSWTDCNLADGMVIEKEFSALPTPKDKSEPVTPFKFNPDPKVHLEKILNDRELKVMVLAGDLDFKVNHMGVETVVKSLNWYGKEQFANSNQGGEPTLWWYKNITDTIKEFQEIQQTI